MVDINGPKAGSRLLSTTNLRWGNQGEDRYHYDGGLSRQPTSTGDFKADSIRFIVTWMDFGFEFRIQIQGCLSTWYHLNIM